MADTVWVVSLGCDDCGFGEPSAAFTTEQAAWDHVATVMAEMYIDRGWGETWLEGIQQRRRPEIEWWVYFGHMLAVTEVPHG